MAPAKLTKEKITKLLGALEAGADMAIAAKIVGVSRQALYKRMQKYPKFRQQVEEAKAVADEIIVRSLYQAAKAGNVTAMIFWLKNRRAREWRDSHDVTAKVDVHHELSDRLQKWRQFEQTKHQQGSGED